MEVVENGVAHIHTSRQLLHELPRHIWIIHVGKDIHKNTLTVVTDEMVALLNVNRIEATNLCDTPLLASRVGLTILEKKVFGQLIRCHLAETSQVGLFHGDVNVIVPRYETTMAHRTKQRSSLQPVINTVLAADAVDDLKDAQLFQLALPQVLLHILLQIFVVFFHVGQ